MELLSLRSLTFERNLRQIEIRWHSDTAEVAVANLGKDLEKKQKQKQQKFQSCEKNPPFSQDSRNEVSKFAFYFLTRRILDILYSAQPHLLELSTMIHVVRNQIKCILVNERPHDTSLAQLCDLICRVYQSE